MRHRKLEVTAFRQAYYENVLSIIDEDVAQMMKDPEVRRIYREFAESLFRVVSARMSGGNGRPKPRTRPRAR